MESGNATGLMSWTLGRNAIKEMQFWMFRSVRTGNITVYG